MLRTSKHTMRALALSGLLALTGGLTQVSAQTGASEQPDSAAIVSEFPLALVYRGIGLYEAKDYQAAIDAFQGYLDRAGKDADTASVNQLLREAWIHEYPLSLVYEGHAFYAVHDVARAINSWRRYIEIATTPDTADVRKLIDQTLIPEDVMAKLEISVRSYMDHEFREITRALSVRTDLAVSEEELSRVRGSKARATEMRVVPQK